MGKVVLEMRDIVKRFPGVLALNGVSLKVYEGEAMALLGENGAGKSTLMKCLTGVYQRDEGSILYNGREIAYTNARQAQDDGIAIIHQELNLIPRMKVYENIFLGREVKKKGGALDKKYMYEKSAELLREIRINISPNALISSLSIAQQQMVEIAKALLMDAKVIVMDEPTDALPDEEVESLFNIIRELKKKNKGIVYISHRLNEIFEICDRATILRDGQFIAEKLVSELDQPSLISMMVGRTLDQQFPYEPMPLGDVVLSVKGLTNNLVRDISFEVRSGEVLGIIGLVGAGRTELAQTIYGLHEWTEGEILLKGKPIHPANPNQAIRHGIYYMTEDRKRNGLVLIMDVRKNISLSALDKITTFGKVDVKKERAICADFIEKINVKTPSQNQRVRNLSGGNQQKVVLSKALMTEPDVLILDEPTRGIDVGAKKEIYLLINQLKERGKAVIMISSEMPEILGMSDRVLVLHEGRCKGELSREEATQEKIMEKILS
ncbi:MAG: sugar ABC transporter ATP-binding protein [Clostridia bacterium]|nr:sugar ABC transporter ATP-binding protein [Clostridia bacterium]